MSRCQRVPCIRDPGLGVASLHRVGALDSELAEIERLVRVVRVADAERRLRALFMTMGDEQLRTWEPDLRQVIQEFHPKRRRALEAALEHELHGTATAVAPTRVGHPVDEDDLVKELRLRIRAQLEDLSANHIFQWATAYRDRFREAFEGLFRLAVRGSADEVAAVARAEVSAHTTEIFTKGYIHTMARLGDKPYPMSKSLGGLQRFIDIPIELYSTRLSRGVSAQDGRVLRCVSSGVTAGVLQGFGRVQFGDVIGSEALSRYVRSWAHALAFLTAADLDAVVEILEPGEFRDGLALTVMPVLQTLDGFNDPSYAPLPALSQFLWEERRLEVDLHPPDGVESPRLLEVQCYLDPAFVRESALESAARRDVAMVVAPIRADLRSMVSADEQLARVVVAPGPGQLTLAAATDRCAALLKEAVFRRRSAREVDQPLRNNFAREFPLNNPSLVRYYHVHRSSIRELLRAFERRNGVRLWCSIRRSGKTTACNDLAGSAGGTVVVTQTCDTTGQIPEGSAFYDAVCDALEEGGQLPATFFADVVRRVAPDSGSSTERYVFVLDEYETLFGRLRRAVRREPDVRYPVVQPLLNQMVVFARDHLLVFLGQQPDAHYILMDQNQLSPYIEQDPFPLFRHEIGVYTTEFTELVQKILTERVVTREGFVDAVYDETGGHPYLTANVLTEFVEWLIDTDRKLGDLVVGPHDFRTFGNSRLVPKRISLTQEYQFFRQAVAGALSDEARAQTPWLHAIYSCLQGMCSGRGALGCSRREFAQLIRERGLGELGFTAEMLLSTGRQANFLLFNHQRVWPRIRILGRISAVTPAAITA
jgi:hypothetical protein